jgi:pSer/pThr/pTyr-binding forkhead associated (FHA) protein
MLEESMNDLSGFFLLILRGGMAVILYTFLGWSIYILWKELRQLAFMTNNEKIPPIQLSTKWRTKLPGKMSFNFPQIFVGRDPVCDFYLENETVSSKHVRLYYQQNQWWVEDLGSSNGTFLNEQSVVIPTVLTDNDQLRCGKVVIDISINN